MKKVFYALLTNILILTSCSSNDDIINNDSSTSNATKYTIEFNVKSANFEIDTTPLRALTDKGTFLQIVAYKESGEVYSDTVIVPEQIKDVISEDGNFPFKLELPNGQYHLAFIQKSYSTSELFNYTPQRFKLKPSNFYTDVYGGGPVGYINPTWAANVNDYYQTIDITIANTSQKIENNVILEPMWSTVSISIDDFTPPTGCNFVTIDVLPAYSLYNLANKLAPENFTTHFFLNMPGGGFQPVKPSVNNGTVVSGLSISKTSSENNNMKLHIKWYSDFNYTLIMTTEIDLKTQIENGLKYTIKGNCSNILNYGGGQINVTYTPFNENEVIDLPFN